MLTRKGGYLFPREASVPAASAQLEREGWALLPGLLSPEDVVAISPSACARQQSRISSRQQPSSAHIALVSEP